TVFFDDMESGSSKWLASSPDPGQLWHIESAPGIAGSCTSFFLSTNIWVPFQGSGFGVVPDFTDESLQTPPMDLLGIFSPNTPTPSLKLQFDQWINLPPDNSVYWSLWITGSNDKVSWTPWQNALGGLEFGGGTNPQCAEGVSVNFNPWDSTRTSIPTG